MSEKHELPKPMEREYKPFSASESGKWLVLSDVHLPYHDVRTVELAIRHAKRERVKGVLLNGDILDSHELSTFDRDPSAPRYIEERDAALKFFDYVRASLPSTRIVYKLGNHEERLERYLWRKAPALYGLPSVTFASIFELSTYGIELVADKRVVRLGLLNVLHGHEYRPSISAPVNPARGLFLRSKAVALCGHWHQTSEHHEPTLEGTPKGCWSTGCSCQLSPGYSPLNKWNHGFAIVEVGREGKFSVRNLRVINGEIT